MKLVLRIAGGVFAAVIFLIFMYLLFSPWPFELTVTYMRTHLLYSTLLYWVAGVAFGSAFFLCAKVAGGGNLGQLKKFFGWICLGLAILYLALLVFNFLTFPHPLWEGYVEKDSTYVLYARQTLNFGFQFAIWGLLAIRYLRTANCVSSQACPADSGCPA